MACSTGVLSTVELHKVPKSASWPEEVQNGETQERTQKEFPGSHEILQGIVDSAMDAIISVDERHRIVVFNPSAERIFGYKAAEVLGGPLDRLLPAQFRHSHSVHIANFGATGTTQRSMQSPGTLTALHSNGQEFPIEATISQVALPAGKAFTVILRDITLRKEAEEMLRVSEEKFAKAFANNPAAIAISRLEDGIFLDVNDTWVDLVGYSRQEALGNSARQMNIWPTTEDAQRFVKEIQEKGALHGWQEQFLNKSGKPFYAQLSAQILRVGDTDAVVSTLIDITERKNAERALEEKARLLDLSSDAIFVRDANNRIIYWNQGALQAYGYTSEEVLGCVPHELLKTEFPQPAAEIRDALYRDGYWSGELVHMHKSGQKLVFASRWSLARDANGQPSAILEANRDITNAKMAQEALIRSEKLASVGRMAATVSHEINNPLAVIMNSVFLASLDKNLSEQSRLALTVAEQELERVAQLTRQTLGFYRENSAPEEIDVAALIEDVVGMYRPKLVARGIEVSFRHREKLHIHAIAGEIRQVVSNLVSNAIDASRPGGRFAIRTTPVRLDGQKAVRLTFADSGEGITAENLHHIFEPFFTTKQSVGTGLGLWVSSQIIERHRGRFSVRSKANEGTVFCIFLPLSPNSQTSTAADRP